MLNTCHGCFSMVNRRIKNLIKIDALTLNLSTPDHSLLRLPIGLAWAALIARALTVNSAMIMAITPAMTKIHQCTSILYTKPSSHFCIINQAIGEAITVDKSTSFKKSADSIATIRVTDAPNTLRIPISLIRCIVAKETNPKRPKQAIKIAMPEAIAVITCVRFC